jgi:hypothetical protein
MIHTTHSALTLVTTATGFNPSWQERFEFTIHMKEQAVFLLMFYDTDPFASVSGRTKLAYYSIPVRCIRAGYRFLPLRDPGTVGAKPIPLCDALCKFEFIE